MAEPDLELWGHIPVTAIWMAETETEVVWLPIWDDDDDGERWVDYSARAAKGSRPLYDLALWVPTW